MNLTLNLNADIEAKLKAQAAITGKRPEELALEALQDKLADEPPSSSQLSIDQWQQQFDAWVSEHRSRNPRLDDSRESIYADRA